MEQSQSQKYIINGTSYSSIEEVPIELRAFVQNIQPHSELTTVNNSNQQSVPTIHFVFLFVSVVLSFAQNEAFKVLMKNFFTFEVHFIFSVIMSIAVGSISYTLAKRELNNNRRTAPYFINNTKFFNDLAVSNLAGGYSFIFYILFYSLILLARNLLY